MGDDLRNEDEERRKHDRGEALHDALGVLEELMPGHIVYTPEALVSMRDHERKVAAELRTLRADYMQLEKLIVRQRKQVLELREATDDAAKDSCEG